MISTLDVIWTIRAGEGGRTERRHLDFVIDGVPLSSRIHADFISPLGWMEVEAQWQHIDRLIRKSPPDLAEGRTTLYVCPECGDLGCGAVSLSVLGGDGVVIWKDFGIQNNCETLVHTHGFEGIGPFTFDGANYHHLLERLRRSSSLAPQRPS